MFPRWKRDKARNVPLVAHEQESVLNRHATWTVQAERNGEVSVYSKRVRNGVPGAYTELGRSLESDKAQGMYNLAK